MKLWEEGLTFSSWAPSINLALPWALPHQAGKFDIIPTMTTIGSGIGIFGVVSTGDTCLLSGVWLLLFYTQ